MHRMTPRRKNPSARLIAQSVETATAAPLVVAHRLGRMAAAGPWPSARQRKENSQMVNEKVLAFYQSWAAMWQQAYRSQMQLAQNLTAAALAPVGSRRRPGASSAALAHAATRILSAGLAPVHTKAVANAKRLGRNKKK
jgi:hypothetical protein